MLLAPAADELPALRAGLLVLAAAVLFLATRGEWAAHSFVSSSPSVMVVVISVVVISVALTLVAFTFVIRRRVCRKRQRDR